MDNHYIRKLCDALIQATSQDELVAVLQDALHVERLRLRAGTATSDPGLFPPNKRKVLEEVCSGQETFRLELVKCGKKDCPCRHGASHGPYWYAYRSVKGKTKSRYVGKQAPPHLEAARKAAQEAGKVQAQAEQGKGLEAIQMQAGPNTKHLGNAIAMRVLGELLSE